MLIYYVVGLHRNDDGRISNILLLYSVRSIVVVQCLFKLTIYNMCILCIICDCMIICCTVGMFDDIYIARGV